MHMASATADMLLATPRRRHDLLCPSPSAWDALLRRRPELTEAALLADWARREWPVIVRRRGPDDGSAIVAAAVPLPPSHGKRRVALDFLPGEALVARPPVRLRDAAGVAPADWQPVIASLDALGDALGLAPCVFGALLWQHLTGLLYLTGRSDLDLLWQVSDAAVAVRLTRALTRLDEAGPIRIDGELVLPDGAGVNWREFARAAGAGATVLAKTIDGVEMRPSATLFDRPVPP